MATEIETQQQLAGGARLAPLLNYSSALWCVFGGRVEQFNSFTAHSHTNYTSRRLHRHSLPCKLKGSTRSRAQQPPNEQFPFPQVDIIYWPASQAKGVQPKGSPLFARTRAIVMEVSKWAAKWSDCHCAPLGCSETDPKLKT